MQEIQEGERNGQLGIERTDIVNAPVVKWPTDRLDGEVRMPDTGSGPATDSGLSRDPGGGR